MLTIIYFIHTIRKMYNTSIKLSDHQFMHYNVCDCYHLQGMLDHSVNCRPCWVYTV